MKILITGVAGFVGRYLLGELSENSLPGDELIGMGIEDISIEECAGLSDYTRLNITDKDEFRNYLTRQRPDVIYHLAALSSVGDSLKRPVETFLVNQMGTLYLLETAVNDLSCKTKVLLVGSADIYKPPKGVKPMNENTPFLPLNPYAASKAAVDYLGEIYWKNYELPVIRTRSFNHIGPGQRLSFVMPNFARQIARIERGLQEPILRVGNLSVRRDFTDVRSVVRAYRLIVERGVPGDVYNVCSGDAVSIEEMLNMLLEKTTADIAVKTDLKRMRKADNPILLGDNSKLKAHTGWQPDIPIRTTLEDLLNYWRKQVENEA